MSERRGTKALELWCRRITEGYPGVKIDNMTTSWRDGLAFCAMIHHFRPDLIDFEKLNQTDIYYNNTLAFTTAEKYLGIPALLDADDMAAYEVPDRLSILTYLSQFYQVFSAQEAHNRLKRSSSSVADKTQVKKSSGPPPKMAHVVGVPKRDPCRKCNLPVFLAERLLVGKNVYHRTCLKCARCGHQLTPGNFYETEIDEQYCCETCPDEEATQKNVEEAAFGSGITVPDCSTIELRNTCESETNRSSIKERLAFFENHRYENESDPKLLQKSLSDEEKSRSLQRIDSSPGTVETSYTPNAALSSFLINMVDDEVPLNKSSVLKAEISDSDEETDDSANISLPPELPESMPPLEELVFEKKPDTTKRFSVMTQLVLASSPDVTMTHKGEEEQSIVSDTTEQNQTRGLQIETSASADDNTSSNNICDEDHISTSDLEVESTAEHQTEEETVQLQPKQLENNLEFSQTNDIDCTTKEKSTDELTAKIAAEDSEPIINRNLAPKTNINFLMESDEIDTISCNDSMEASNTELRTTTNEDNSNTAPQLENDENTESLSVIHGKDTVPPQKSSETAVESEIFTNAEDVAYKLVKNSSVEPITDQKEIVGDNIKIESETRSSLNTALIDDKVPLTVKTEDKDNDKEVVKENNFKENIYINQAPQTNNSKITNEEYPEDLNPFKSDEEEEDGSETNKENTIPVKKHNLNPFDSSDDEVELEKTQKSRNSITSASKVPPPRPPPPRVSKNPFGSEDEEETTTHLLTRNSSPARSHTRKTPVPTPRSNASHSLNPTPEPTPRLSAIINTTIGSSASATPNNSFSPVSQSSCEFYGSCNSLHSNSITPYNLLRNSDIRSSNNSLNLSAGGTIRSRKSRRAPLPPASVKELFPAHETSNSSSKTSTPCSSTVGSPKQVRKKRPAPAPPKPARFESLGNQQEPKNLNNYPLQRELDSKLSDEEKALLEGKTLQSPFGTESDLPLTPSNRRSSKRLIPLDRELLEEHGSLQRVEEGDSQCDDLKQQKQDKSSLALCEEESNVVYRRVLIPQNLETPTHEQSPPMHDPSESPSIGERQLEKLKDNKEANNRNRQSQVSVTSSGADDNDPLFNKSAHGKWKRRKGPAPALPIPPRKVLQMLPLQEIKHELEIIEVQQQGLEKQGVILEKMIRDRCEGENGELINSSVPPCESGSSTSSSSTSENSKEVENLILQLFELVNEKNELFRRQAELMYLRRQHRLEQEQADLEYEIRILMAQPERNKTDSDKAREEALIERLVEVVQLRNEVVECLEMDRLREAEEDQSIKQRLEFHIAKREDELNTGKAHTKLSKKEKRKQKEAKKLSKSKQLDADKDADESEVNVDKQKPKKKKKLLIF